MERVVLFAAVLLALLVFDFEQTLLAFPLLNRTSAPQAPDQNSSVHAEESAVVWDSAMVNVLDAE